MIDCFVIEWKKFDCKSNMKHGTVTFERKLPDL